MANTAWKCIHPGTGDVKIAVREDHANKLELKGYVCVLDPDQQWDEHDSMIYIPEDDG